MKTRSTEQARRDEEVGFGITSFGVGIKKLQCFFYQGLFCNCFIYIRVLDSYSTDKRKTHCYAGASWAETTAAATMHMGQAQLHNMG